MIIKVLLGASVSLWLILSHILAPWAKFCRRSAALAMSRLLNLAPMRDGGEGGPADPDKSGLRSSVLSF